MSTSLLPSMFQLNEDVQFYPDPKSDAFRMARIEAVTFTGNKVTYRIRFALRPDVQLNPNVPSCKLDDVPSDQLRKLEL